MFLLNVLITYLQHTHCFCLIDFNSPGLMFLCLQVNLDDLFSPLQFGSVRRSGLTLLREDDEPESARQQQTPHITVLRPMEISAFRVEIS